MIFENLHYSLLHLLTFPLSRANRLTPARTNKTQNKKQQQKAKMMRRVCATQTKLSSFPTLPSLQPVSDKYAVLSRQKKTTLMIDQLVISPHRPNPTTLPQPNITTPLQPSHTTSLPTTAGKPWTTPTVVMPFLTTLFPPPHLLPPTWDLPWLISSPHTHRYLYLYQL